MTKEEIIEECKQRLGFETDCEMYSLCQHEKDFYNAIIKALEQPNSDCVSRQAVIDMTGLSNWFESSDDYNSFVEELCKLPPVTPKNPTSDDCVSRQAVIEYIEACGAELGHDLENESVREDILNMPPATPTRKSGLRWIERFDNEDKWLECPHCHKDSDNAYAYCPNCGASFKEEKRGDENVSS